MNLRIAARLSCALLLSGASAASAQSVEDFYKGRPSTCSSAAAGGGYDVYYRALARHMGRHIPGNPTIHPEEPAGGSGLAAAAALYTTAEKDGATIGAFPNNVPMDPLFGNPGARYDALKLNWLGSIGKLQNVCATWHRARSRPSQQAREREVIVAAAAAPTNTRDHAARAQRAARHEIQADHRLRSRRRA